MQAGLVRRAGRGDEQVAAPGSETYRSKGKKTGPAGPVSPDNLGCLRSDEAGRLLQPGEILIFYHALLYFHRTVTGIQ